MPATLCVFRTVVEEAWEEEQVEEQEVEWEVEEEEQEESVAYRCQLTCT